MIRFRLALPGTSNVALLGVASGAGVVGRDSELMIPGLAGESGREAELLEHGSDIGAGLSVVCLLLLPENIVTFYYGGLSEFFK